MPRGRSSFILGALVATAIPGAALGAGPPVAFVAEKGADAGLVKRVREIVAGRRALREDLALPPAASSSTDQAAAAQTAASIRLALERARRAESEASWDACVREAAGAMSEAVVVLAKVDDLLLLHDLHVQMGVCLTLAENAPSARPHFVSAALLDEQKPAPGLHREEAEKEQAEALAEVVARARGKVRIETAPPGAELWIDGHKAAGVTPLDVDVRLGDHFVTARRFRFEPHTELVSLQPSGAVRVVLDPAQRATLHDQLAAVASGALSPNEDEMRLARAVWSRAEQVVTITPIGLGACRVRVLDALTGEALRAVQLTRGLDDDSLRRSVCDALGETCDPPRKGGVPWYVWPIAGVAVVGGVVSTALIINANRSLTFVSCPPGMVCH